MFKDKYFFSKKDALKMGTAIEFEDKYYKVHGMLQRIILQDGKEILNEVDDNLIVLLARKLLAHLIGEADTDYILTQFALGDGHHVGGPGQGGDLLTQIEPVEVDTVLEQELYREDIDSYNYPDDTSVQFVTTLEQGEGQGGALPDPCAYTEAAMFTNSTHNRMFCIKSFPAMIKDNTREFVFKWTIIF